MDDLKFKGCFIISHHLSILKLKIQYVLSYLFEIFLLGQAKPVHAWNGFETAIKTAFRAS